MSSLHHHHHDHVGTTATENSIEIDVTESWDQMQQQQQQQQEEQQQDNAQSDAPHRRENAAEQGEHVSRESHGEGSASTRTTKSKTVTFKEVELRRYPIILGDHPSPSEGPPLTLGWDYYDMGSFSLDDVEAHRCPRRRHGEESLRLSAERRRAILASALVANEGDFLAKQKTSGGHIKRQRSWPPVLRCLSNQEIHGTSHHGKNLDSTKLNRKTASNSFFRTLRRGRPRKSPQ